MKGARVEMVRWMDGLGEGLGLARGRAGGLEAGTNCTKRKKQTDTHTQAKLSQTTPNTHETIEKKKDKRKQHKNNTTHTRPLF